MHPATAVVADIVAAITPLDPLEQEHIEQTLSWLAGTDDIFRREPPVTPPQHLVSYVVVVEVRACVPRGGGQQRVRSHTATNIAATRQVVHPVSGPMPHSA
ncbi:hypothetical protein C5E45_12905 [Nocardia nova]|uniref:Uncharacterized protein n=1 Tax=Nocardia nova TaxID=37330 RepID=A0A2S6AQT0_9NOCA|nr:hypothetical protein [Nocardia nova]PPJ22038.1 hypothetical protein C5E41_28525 [Nocardia nova]PPJ37578.1 hypothetical protein C5E45_12905 [Nocardia nova]